MKFEADAAGWGKAEDWTSVPWSLPSAVKTGIGVAVTCDAIARKDQLRVAAKAAGKSKARTSAKSLKHQTDQ